MGSRPSPPPPPPLPSAITTTQCQHPPKGRHLHQYRRCRRRRSSSNSGNHSNSQSHPQREQPATASRDFPGVRSGAWARGRARTCGLARSQGAFLPSSAPTRRRRFGSAPPPARSRPPASESCKGRLRGPGALIPPGGMEPGVSVQWST